jgi:type I restriction enzyme M protein
MNKYLYQKQNKLYDYEIFMAIAEDIGYDAVGKQTGNNELEVIEKQLSQFIIDLVNEEKP